MKKRLSFLLVLILVVLVCCTGCTSGSPSVSCEYESRLFSTDTVHTVSVTLAEPDWENLKTHPLDKTKYSADVTIDGETFLNVSFATKGNSSLAAVAARPDSNRYSFKINFGKYDKEQTYHGLNKLHLNNLFGDSTLMKDFFSYELFRHVGVSAPLVSYVWLTVNEKPAGLYLAVEDMSESFLARTLNNKGVLYKPEAKAVDNARLQFDLLQDSSGNTAADTSPAVQPSAQSQVSCQGADLVYIDEEISSYPDLFEHVQTPAETEDFQRLIAALKGFHEMKNPEEYLNTKEITAYFAAHNFVLNGDSYTGAVPTNYLLHELNGKLAMLPWDYNLAFGAFPAGSPLGGPGAVPGSAPGEGSGNPPGDPSFDPAALIPAEISGEMPPEALSMLLNTGIYSPLFGIPDYQRPMWAWILSNEYFMNMYRDALGRIVSGYFPGTFESQADRLYQMLLPYVEKDPSAFYTAEEFALGFKTFKSFCLLRAQSVRAQLDGKLSPATFSQNPEDRIDTSGIDMPSMGTPLHDSPLAQ